jgi:hypothetical protein
MSDAIEPLAVVTDYDGLVTALRQRIVELGTSIEAVDGIIGLPTRYTGKLLNGARGIGRVSLGSLLGALALKLAVMPDNDALARLRHRLPQRGTRGPKLTTAARRRQARALAAALMRLQKGGRGGAGGSSSADRVAYGGATEIGDLHPVDHELALAGEDYAALDSGKTVDD